MSHEWRRQFLADKKAESLRRHLVVDNAAVSDLRDAYKVQPRLFRQIGAR